MKFTLLCGAIALSARALLACSHNTDNKTTPSSERSTVPTGAENEPKVYDENGTGGSSGVGGAQSR